MTRITLENLGRDFGEFTALANMDLTIADGEFVALLGPSGCGKSTTMNMIAGMLEPSHGEIRFDGRNMNGVPMAKRGVGFVFQNYAIFTHMSVRDNLAYGLKAQGVGRAEIARRVGEIAELLQLSPLLDRRAAGLSVNILQRLAIGRSAVVEPSIFLMDEPLSNVDAAFRAVMRSELKGLQRQFKQTMVYVTHDQLEAMTMADRIAVMDHGKLLQVGTPLEVYNHPADTFVARFIGAPGMNLLPGRVTGGDGAPVIDLGAAGHSGALRLEQTGDILFGFRPEEVVPDANGPLAMQVTAAERIGPRIILHLAAGDHRAKVVLDGETPAPQQGETFRFSVPERSVRLFDAQTERAL
ncbi:ABC transporter ATP-binding protein [Arenibacterium halophilum]|uniref:ABC transporter ATP-binding protein n=1 Tax=Arenibacterium halophilum TaxID=2583821 RepID=A0ABY2XFL0_9RHOB|nr:ABC transporter ATP-binding protein [Arenibacterium halophilum]TMV15267.1 ABC transporter ATP-binding protein [Arenibacterium halophilum]